MSENYAIFDELFGCSIEILNDYNNSEILQNYFSQLIESFFYASIIDNFFRNLTSENLKEYGLSADMRENIESDYNTVKKDVNLIINPKGEEEFKKIDEKYYNRFKKRLKDDYPKLLNLMIEIEKEIDYDKFKKYLRDKKKKMKESGRNDPDLHSKIMTKIIEANIKKNNTFSLGKDMDKIRDGLVNNLLPDLAQIYFKSFKSFSQEMLIEQKEDREEFESILYGDWKEPLDLLECLIRVSLESVDKHRRKIISNGFKEDIKFNALIKIHARALQIGNEVLVLLKAGYPNGANARWRSLHELTVISIFLSDNDDIVSQRYLEHEIIMRYKEALNYQKHYEKLGYAPHKKETLDNLEERKNELCNKYGKDYYKDWGWIPKEEKINQSFSDLEKKVGLDRLHPFYKLSSAHIHGSSRGFYNLGVLNDFQNKILGVGASNYGLADPIQNVAISLMNITNCLLNFQPDFDSITTMKINHYFVKEIKTKAVEIQDRIKKSS